MDKCFDCGGSGPLHAHHVVPRSMGGTATVDLCESCHGKVHGRALTTSALTSMAMKGMSDDGKYTGGHVRYGYRVSEDGVSLVPDPAEQEVIAAVLEYRAEGLSLRRIADRLAEHGFTSRTGRTFNHSSIRTIVKQAA